MSKTKKCPFCAETIKAEAIVCHYCKRDLPTNEARNISVKKHLNNEDEIEELKNYVYGLKRKYYTDKHIIELLENQGLDRDTILIVMGMDKTTLENSIKVARAQGENMMFWGFLLFFGGVFITFVSYEGAGSGGTYVVAAGAIFWGLVRIIRGWNMKQKAK